MCILQNETNKQKICVCDWIGAFGFVKIVEELESLDLDNPPFGDEDKFKDWQSEFEDDYNLMRMK